MRTPTTVKGYLKLLIQIAEERSGDLKDVTEEEMRFIGYMRGAMQNELSQDEYGILRKYKLEYKG